ncbi:MAG: hypothetical protein QOE36_1058 [Gaiellaceae bacterium]|jgi:uncharacterized membrane protein|nr:hypothetical protein [Gaiellaceae bacterium]
MPRTRNDRTLAIGSLLLSSAFCMGLLVVRKHYTGDGFRFLAWNLFLAWIPFLLAVLAYDSSKRGFRVSFLPLAALWLLFFPNAPYIVTDLFHLRDLAGVAPLWFDVLVFTAFAWTGLLLGLISVYLMQAAVRRLAGSFLSWAAVVPALALASFGIYLGRFERWNSWDAINRPHALLASIHAHLAEPQAYPHAVAYTALFTGFLTVAYLVLYAFGRLVPSGDVPRPRP